ncbi:MAG: hypothetical protein ACK5QC_10065 [Bacteroidota bacterium]|jgi:hypothetical protein
MVPVEILIDEFGNKLVDDLKASLKKKGVMYQTQESKLAASIRFRTLPKGDSIEFQLLMPAYAELVDEGRKPDPVSKKGKKKIGEWGDRKGMIGKFSKNELINRKKKQDKAKARNKNRKVWKTLKEQPFNKAKKAFAYVVSRKIAEKGYEGNNFFTDVINDGRIDELKKDLIEYGFKNFKFGLE